MIRLKQGPAMKTPIENGQDDASKKRKTQWKQDPDAVKADILRVATEEFATNGLSGARIDEIARRTRASKRMIYYYFDDKEGLYRSVLESVYATLRGNEARLMVDDLEPVAALRKLVELTFDAHAKAPDFVRLVMIENIHHAEYLKQSGLIPGLNRAIIDKLEDVCARGKALGLFHESADPLELHWFISSLSFYNVSNRATFSTSFGKELFTPKGQARLRRRAVDLILGAVVKDYASAAQD
jgi:AcrR family transcriptional regulator